MPLHSYYLLNLFDIYIYEILWNIENFFLTVLVIYSYVVPLYKKILQYGSTHVDI